MDQGAVIHLPVGIFPDHPFLPGRVVPDVPAVFLLKKGLVQFTECYGEGSVKWSWKGHIKSHGLTEIFKTMHVFLTVVV
jgi:hypothetical protein